MGDKFRTIRRDDWDMITKKTIIIEPVSYKNMAGKISLLIMDEVKEPFIIGGKKIVDKNYKWIQIAFEKQYFWLTCMFDENDNFIEIYIDLTNGNITDVENPYFEDMYLDFDVYPEKIIELDRDELDEAYADKLINKEQYERTIAEGAKLRKYLEENKDEIINDIKKEFQYLLEKIPK